MQQRISCQFVSSELLPLILRARLRPLTRVRSRPLVAGARVCCIAPYVTYRTFRGIFCQSDDVIRVSAVQSQNHEDRLPFIIRTRHVPPGAMDRRRIPLCQKHQSPIVTYLLPYCMWLITSKVPIPCQSCHAVSRAAKHGDRVASSLPS